jgi:hypothetical protein
MPRQSRQLETKSDLVFFFLSLSSNDEILKSTSCDVSIILDG